MSQPPEDDPPAGVTESSYFGISRINHEDGSKCLVYSDGEGIAERWLTAKGWARVSQEKREELAAEYPKFCVLFEARAAGLKREAVRAAEAVSKAKAEKKKTFGQCPMGRKIKEGRPGQRWPWPKRIYDEASEHRCGIADLLNCSWLKLLATDKDTLVSQTREYGFAKGALWGTQEKIDGEFSQVGRSADAWPVVEDEHGNVTYGYTRSEILQRTVPKEWKEGASGSAATYWHTEVRRIKPEFVIKLTNAEQLKYAKLLAGVAETSAQAGYNSTRGTKQTEHGGGGWPGVPIEHPDGILIVIYRAIFYDEASYKAYFGRKKKGGGKAGSTYRTGAADHGDDDGSGSGSDGSDAGSDGGSGS